MASESPEFDVHPITAKQRFEVCRRCPQLDQKIRMLERCRESGGFMRAKVQIATATCPKGLW